VSRTQGFSVIAPSGEALIMRPEIRNKALEIFHELFGPYLDADDRMEFYSNRKLNKTETFLRSDIYKSKMLSAVILEEYSVKSRMGGNVIIVLPDPQYDIPVFSFQLGGNDSQSIALLDISPTLPDVDFTPLLDTYEKYRELLGIDAPKVAWVKSISSPHLLHCQYGELDEELFLEAMRAYLEIWIKHYYLPGKKLIDEGSISAATNAVYKFKYVLHDNDPAYGVFAKAWGKPVADAFFFLETSQHPALPMPGEKNTPFKAWKNAELNVLWTREAQECVYEAPSSVHQLIRDAIEKRAAKDNIGIITLDVWNKYKNETSNDAEQLVE
jgi:hypothetical protein